MRKVFFLQSSRKFNVEITINSFCIKTKLMPTKNITSTNLSLYTKTYTSSCKSTIFLLWFRLYDLILSFK